MHGLHRRAAKPVHGHASHGFGQAGQQTDDARQIVALRGLGVGTAEDHVLQECRIEVRALQQTLYDLGCQRVRPHFGEAAFAGELEWRARISCNNGFHDMGSLR